MRREIALRGGENRRRSTSNDWRGCHRPGIRPDGPNGSSSDTREKKVARRLTVNTTVLRHTTSRESSMISTISGSIGKGLVSCMSKASYTNAPIITEMMATTAKTRMRFRHIAMSVHGQAMHCRSGSTSARRSQVGTRAASFSCLPPASSAPLMHIRGLRYQIVRYSVD
jgi:hypothetical protein